MSGTGAVWRGREVMLELRDVANQKGRGGAELTLWPKLVIITLLIEPRIADYTSI